MGVALRHGQGQKSPFDVILAPIVKQRKWLWSDESSEISYSGLVRVLKPAHTLSKVLVLTLLGDS